jgi:hypothetical protein
VTLKEHVVFGGVAAAALAPVLGMREAGAFWAASVLIDVDHYWDFLYRNRFRNWSPGKMFAFHRALFPKARRRDFLGLNLFHTVEFFALVSAAGMLLGSRAVLAALLGLVYHLALDLIRLATHRALFARALSIVEYVVRRRRLVRHGIDPTRVYREALVEIGLRAPGPVPALAVGSADDEQPLVPPASLPRSV